MVASNSRPRLSTPEELEMERLEKARLARKAKNEARQLQEAEVFMPKLSATKLPRPPPANRSGTSGPGTPVKIGPPRGVPRNESPSSKSKGKRKAIDPNDDDSSPRPRRHHKND